MFLVMPVSWKGTLAQYVGRLHRDHDGKREVIVYDYVDRAVPVLARMAARREKGLQGSWICRRLAMKREASNGRAV